jgi:hypothetical protein
MEWVRKIERGWLWNGINGRAGRHASSRSNDTPQMALVGKLGVHSDTIEGMRTVNLLLRRR